jgi:ribosomal protein S18 acetylase RimI-like enzyme
MRQPSQVTDIRVRPGRPTDQPSLDAMFAATWGEPRVAAGGRLYDLRALPALVATREAVGGAAPQGAGTDEALEPSEQIIGVLTYEIAGDAIEVVSIEADPPRLGTGTALLAAAINLGFAEGLARLWLVTTNDNVDALRFYQRRGLHILKVRPDGVARSRAVKPSIPLIGSYGIPMRDEIVLGRDLSARDLPNRDLPNRRP